MPHLFSWPSCVVSCPKSRKDIVSVVIVIIFLWTLSTTSNRMSARSRGALVDVMFIRVAQTWMPGGYGLHYTQQREKVPKNRVTVVRPESRSTPLHPAACESVCRMTLYPMRRFPGNPMRWDSRHDRCQCSGPPSKLTGLLSSALCSKAS